MSLQQEQLKKMAAQAAIDYIAPHLQADMILGIGTGSTADLFIDALESLRTKFKGAVASSDRSAARLKSVGISVFDLNDVSTLRFYIDGADEINGNLDMLKGGGGALTREKIVASVAQQFICIVDQSKCVEVLGQFPLPIEVIDLSVQSVMRWATLHGGQPSIRENFRTDNGHPIIDVKGLKITDPQAFESMLNHVPGVVTNGLFALRGADVAFVSGSQGVQTLLRSS
jgi:ribose 5-phosphate isomerase A